ncbi:MAG: NADPH:quinone reductase [Oceanospirillaceae bacterium]|nr:NADPH:quinone reductase [Oceanospirillaceae bacterium]
MKAVWYEKTGSASEVLMVGDLEKPLANAGEVLVRLYASAVNPSDVKARAGLRAGGSGMPYPMITPHSDGAGIIEAVGDGVSDRQVGQRVWVFNGQWARAFGTAAQYISLPATQVVPLADNVSYATGAALGIPAVTASYCVYSNGEVAGQSLLIHGGAGTVGLLAVQLAKIGGAFVIATARGAENQARVKAAGADRVIDFTADNLSELILTANAEHLIDRIIDVEFGVNINVNAEIIKPHGKIVAYGSAQSHTPELPFYPLMFKAVNLEFVLVYLLTEQQHREAAARVNQALAEDKLHITIHATYSLEQTDKAHIAVESGGKTGAIIINID